MRARSQVIRLFNILLGNLIHFLALGDKLTVTTNTLDKVDECAEKTHNCDNKAICTDKVDGFTCTCDTGYIGDGLTCTGCCAVVTISGSQRSSRNQDYYKSQDTVNDRALYVDASERYAIWFDGTDDWMLGSFSNIAKGKLTYGYMFNDEDVQCPVDSKKWKEYYHGSWSIKEAISFKCKGSFNLMSFFFNFETPNPKLGSLTLNFGRK